jgi:hypothetical protein
MLEHIKHHWHCVAPAQTVGDVLQRSGRAARRGHIKGCHGAKASEEIMSRW